MAAVMVAVVCAASVGCQKAAPPAVAAKPAEVLFEQPQSQVVTEFEEFTGRTSAVHNVEVRARVSGILEKVLFTDGDTVAAGTPLFEIDDRQFRANAARARAVVDQTKARLDKLSLQEDRAETLLERKAIPEEQFEQIRYDRVEAQASLAVAEADLQLAELNLSYARVAAPISGRISRRLVDPGNLIRADETPMTTIVSTNPMHAYFDFDERTVLRLRRLVSAGSIATSESVRLPVQVALADDDDFSLSGAIDFTDNHVDPHTGTLRVRAVIDNTQGLLSAGLFVRVRVPIGNPHPALLIPEIALGTDQGERFVYVVNDKNEIAYRRVQVGWLTDGKRVIEDGLTTSDRVVVNGLQRVRAGTPVIATHADVALTQAAPSPAVASQVTPAHAAASQPAASPKNAKLATVRKTSGDAAQ